LTLPREIVVAVDVEESDTPIIIGALIGLGAGLGMCALAGVFGEDDFNAFGKMLFTGVCAGGGAALGYLIDRNRNQPSEPPERRRIFQRTTAASTQ
jgi:hypothetical protein